MTSAADLLALQELDLRRDGRRALIADIDSRLGETEELVAARERVAEAEAEVQRLQRAQRDVDARLADLDAKIKPIEKKLYDGSVRNPKDLTDMQKELDHLKAQRDKLDDEGLALIDEAEAAAARLANLRSRYEAEEELWKEDQEALRQERARAERESSALEEERAKRTKGMDAGALALYETLRSLKQGRAVAEIQRGTCQGCRLTLPTHLVQRVRAGEQLVQCPSCERILVAS